jgi:hypothetical protein
MKCTCCGNELGEKICDYCGSKMGINTKMASHFIWVCPNMGCPYFGYTDEQLEQNRLPVFWRAEYKKEEGEKK